MRYLVSLALLTAILTGCSSNSTFDAAYRKTSPRVVQKQPLPAPNWTWVHVPFLNKKAADPLAIASDGKSFLWFVDENNQLGSVSMAQQIRTYPLSFIPLALTVGPDGNIWVVGNTPSFTSSVVAKVSPLGAETDYTIDGGGHLGRFPGIVTGPDGALWFSISGSVARGIGRITTSGAYTFYSFPSTDPFGMAIGSDGNLWTADYAGALDKITTTGVETTYPANGSPFTIAAGPDGALYFSSIDGTFGRMTTGGSVSYYGVYNLSALTNGPEHLLWANDSQNLFTFNPTTSTLTNLSKYPGGSIVNSLAVGPDRNIWVTSGETVGTYVRLALNVTPTSLAIDKPGDSGTLEVTESHFNGSWVGSSSATSIATVTQTEAGVFTVRGVSVGNCRVTIRDGNGNYVVVSIVVQ